MKNLKIKIENFNVVNVSGEMIKLLFFSRFERIVDLAKGDGITFEIPRNNKILK